MHSFGGVRRIAIRNSEFLCIERRAQDFSRRFFQMKMRVSLLFGKKKKGSKFFQLGSRLFKLRNTDSRCTRKLMDQYHPNSFRSLWSDTRRIPCRWINCSSAKYICNHGKKTAAGRGCPSSRRGPSASTSFHGSSSQSYSLSSTSRTGPRTCFGRKRGTSKS